MVRDIACEVAVPSYKEESPTAPKHWLEHRSNETRWSICCYVYEVCNINSMFTYELGHSLLVGSY